MSIKVNGQLIGADTYPNQERIYLEPSIPYNASIIVDFKYENDIDIAVLMIIKRYLDESYSHLPVILNMPYIPYSRMDRKIPGYIFSLKYFCRLINDLGFDEVRVLDPHSGMSSGLLDRVTEHDLNTLVKQVLGVVDVDYIFYPDAGAMKRYSEALDINRPYFYGNKKHNLNTGAITAFELVNCPSDIAGKSILIVDDLCAKGGTAMTFGSLIKEAQAKDVFLYVSHCENSIYAGKILETDVITRVFTTDSILTQPHDKIQILRYT